MTEGNKSRLHKAELAAIALLWSALVGVGSFSLGSAGQSTRLRIHENGGHAATQTQFRAIQRQLTDIKADVREIRNAVRD